MTDGYPFAPLLHGEVFEVDLVGHGSRVKMNGIELPSVTDIKIHQPLTGLLEVTVTFLAKSVKGISET